MKKTIILIIIFLLSLVLAYAQQKGINYSRVYPGGGKLQMFVDSSAKNVYYAIGVTNQPRTYFSYLPNVNRLSIRINFRKKINVKDYRYTILVDGKPIALNRSIDIASLKDTNAGGDEELFTSTILGTFAIKDQVVTTLVYNIEKPQDIDKSVFYGKLIPKSIIKGFSKRFKTDKGVDYSWVTDPGDSTKFVFSEKDDELTIVTNKPEIEYLYNISIRDKRTNEVIFKSNTLNYGGIIDEEHEPLPLVNIDKKIFKRSGDYEIIIQPSIDWDNCFNGDISKEEIEKSITRHTLSITLDEESYSKKQLFLYSFIIAFSVGSVFMIILYFGRRRNRQQLKENEQQKEIAKLQLGSIRSQLNPHFMFNALAGIQSLMNQNQTDEANAYLGKFSRLTRNVLDNKELISLNEEQKLLDDYLHMEQLRFGFIYKIKIGDDVDSNVEIPSMLLQPFVENAVKHGIANKAESGLITISFYKDNSNLILELTDNGNGFDTHTTYEGLGLQLSKNRIALLNDIYKENDLVLTIKSDNNGTLVNIKLEGWI